MQIALVHDYLTQYGGAERVLEVLHRQYPDAPVVTAILDRSTLPASFREMRIIDGGLGRIPGASRRHRAFLPVYPAVFHRLGSAVSGADVVLADSSAWAHHIGVGPEQTLVCYCHSPARFLYGDADYLDPLAMGGAAKAVMNGMFRGLRARDQRAARRVDHFIANSRNVAERIARVYGREAAVVPPPVDLSRFRGFENDRQPEEWFLVVSRLVPHKRIDLAVDACRRVGLPLKVIGDGRAREDLQSRAGAGVEFLGAMPDDVVADYLSRCRALILPGAEDFGMTSIEAQAAGRPVVAFGKGGALESVIEGQTGLFFRVQTVDSLSAVLMDAYARKWDGFWRRLTPRSCARSRPVTRSGRALARAEA
jgi:glycosyltransferase involved in cell wall biosynthesis